MHSQVRSGSLGPAHKTRCLPGILLASALVLFWCVMRTKMGTQAAAGHITRPLWVQRGRRRPHDTYWHWRWRLELENA